MKWAGSKIQILVCAISGSGVVGFSCGPVNCNPESGEILSVATMVERGDKGPSGEFPQSCVVEFKVPNIVELLSGMVGFDSDGGFPVVPVGSPWEQAPSGP